MRVPLTLERSGPWVVIGTLVAAVVVLLGVLVYRGTIFDPWGNHLRGYTVAGTLLGTVAAIFGAVSFAYSMRKRAWQERLANSGSMMAWLGLHVTLGVCAMVAALVHAGFGVISPSWSTGKVLLIAFGVLTLSGVVWRVVYRWIPPRATARVGNYSAAASAERARQLDVEIDKALAGQPEELTRIAQSVVDRPDAPTPSLDEESAKLLVHIRELAGSRERALGRARDQQRYNRWLQLWRVLHVPAALLVPLLLVAHVWGALRVHERAITIGGAPTETLSGFAASRECRECHKLAYTQWSRSMHAHAMNSPVTVAQNNQVVRDELNDDATPDPRLICINCHGPVGVALTQQAEEVLPLTRDGYRTSFLNEGIGCVTCHQLRGEPEVGRAGLSVFQRDLSLPGGTYFGPIDDPVGNAYHQSAFTELWQRSEELCRNCHNVVYDLNDDGKIEPGDDLILQRTTEEYDAYRKGGGETTCLECHMPVVEGASRAAERALLWFEQDGEAPDRVVHDHSFVGVDHPLDVAPDRDPQRKARERLLASAATVSAALSDAGLTVTITNSGSGHNLPTGLAFARQMWFEVVARDAAGGVVFSSGVVAKATDDLCDENALSEAGLVPHIRGCAVGADVHLVNYQQKLIDNIDSIKNDAGQVVVVAGEGAQESVLQRLRGGVIARVRPFDKQKQAPLPPDKSQSFVFPLPRFAAKVTVRLLFRSFAPYFLRKLAAGQPDGEKPELAPLIANLQIAEMQRLEVVVPP